MAKNSLKALFIQGEKVNAKELDDFIAQNDYEQIPFWKFKTDIRQRSKWLQGPYFCKVRDDAESERRSTVVIGVHRRKGRIYGIVDNEI